jgi:hypothetical protein
MMRPIALRRSLTAFRSKAAPLVGRGARGRITRRIGVTPTAAGFNHDLGVVEQQVVDPQVVDGPMSLLSH